MEDRFSEIRRQRSMMHIPSVVETAHLITNRVTKSFVYSGVKYASLVVNLALLAWLIADRGKPSSPLLFGTLETLVTCALIVEIVVAPNKTGFWFSFDVFVASLCIFSQLISYFAGSFGETPVALVAIVLRNFAQLLRLGALMRHVKKTVAMENLEPVAFDNLQSPSAFSSAARGTSSSAAASSIDMTTFSSSSSSSNNNNYKNSIPGAKVSSRRSSGSSQSSQEDSSENEGGASPRLQNAFTSVLGVKIKKSNSSTSRKESETTEKQYNSGKDDERHASNGALVDEFETRDLDDDEEAVEEEEDNLLELGEARNGSSSSSSASSNDGTGLGGGRRKTASARSKGRKKGEGGDDEEETPLRTPLL